MDITNSFNIATLAHDTKIDWLELSAKANRILFRDKKRRLFLYDIQTQKRITLLSMCSFVQWVPNSDVAVAQNRNNLCIW